MFRRQHMQGEGKTWHGDLQGPRRHCMPRRRARRSGRAWSTRSSTYELLSARQCRVWQASAACKPAEAPLALLGQGEVEQISMMKPKAVGPHEGGMLEYLEDIIGTDRYVPQIEAGAKRCAASCCCLPLSASAHVVRHGDSRARRVCCAT